jgi:hypothetical protein
LWFNLDVSLWGERFHGENMGNGNAKPSPYHWKSTPLTQHYETVLTRQLQARKPTPQTAADWHHLGDLYDHEGNFAWLDNRIKTKPTACRYPIAHQHLVSRGTKAHWNLMDSIFARYLPSRRFPGQTLPPLGRPSQETVDSYHDVLWWVGDGFALLAGVVGEVAEVVSLRAIGLFGAAAGFAKETVHVVRRK